MPEPTVAPLTVEAEHVINALKSRVGQQMNDLIMAEALLNQQAQEIGNLKGQLVDALKIKDIEAKEGEMLPDAAALG